MIDLDEFLQDRYAALMSLDFDTVNAYRIKYGEQPMPNIELAWAAIHKARCLIINFPEDAKAISRTWLEDRGYRTEL